MDKICEKKDEVLVICQIPGSMWSFWERNEQ